MRTRAFLEICHKCQQLEHLAKFYSKAKGKAKQLGVEDEQEGCMKGGSRRKDHEEKDRGRIRHGERGQEPCKVSTASALASTRGASSAACCPWVSVRRIARARSASRALTSAAGEGEQSDNESERSGGTCVTDFRSVPKTRRQKIVAAGRKRRGKHRRSTCLRETKRPEHLQRGRWTAAASRTSGARITRGFRTIFGKMCWTCSLLHPERGLKRVFCQARHAVPAETAMLASPQRNWREEEKHVSSER